MQLGSHYIIELFATEKNSCEHQDHILIEQWLSQAWVTILSSHHHIFPNQAATFMYLLSESHCVIHTRPEHRYVHVDCFFCDQNKNHDHIIRDVEQFLKTYFLAESTKITTIS